MGDVSRLRPLRHDYIVDQVARTGGVRIGALSAVLGVSASTVRRDIEVLERQGVVRRVHGGAVGVPSAVQAADAAPVALPETVSLVDACSALIGSGSTVAMSGAATASAVAAVARAGPARVVTNDLAVLRAFRAVAADLHVVLTPGVLSRSGTVVGPDAVHTLRAHRPGLALVGAAGLCGTDVLAAGREEAEIGAALVSAATTALLLADRAAARSDGLVRFAALSDFAVVLTGNGLHRDRWSPPSVTGEDGRLCPTCRNRL